MTDPDAPHLATSQHGPRRLRIWQFLVFVAVYIGVVQGVNLLLTAGQDVAYAQPTSVDYLIRSYVVPVGLGAMLAVGFTAYLGVWQEVFVERQRFRRWTLVIPGIVLVCALAVTHYAGLGEKGLAHGSNVFVAGPQALVQVVATTATGFLFYLVLRSSGALVVAMAAHGLWDFSVISTQVDPDAPSPLANLAVVALAIVFLIAVVARKRFSPAPPHREPAR